VFLGHVSYPCGMAKPRILPDNRTLERWVKDEGLTQEQVCDRVQELTGIRPARSTVGVALSRAGLTKPTPRYDEEIPWVLTGRDLMAYPVRMLRLLGRRRQGGDMTDDENNRLDSWLEHLRELNAVVAWDPDASPAVFYVEREPGDGIEVPIRRRRVWLNP
jgi:hypothetical protein